MIKTYGELKKGDVIRFHGANVRVIETCNVISRDGQHIIYFEIEPFDHEALEILGNFYAYGRYGGNAELEIVSL